MIKICENCNKEFETENPNKRFCTRSCKASASKKRIKQGIRLDNIKYTLICEHCGNEFTTLYKDKKYCSDCRKIIDNLKSKEYHNKNKDYNKEYYKTHKEYFDNHNKNYHKFTHICLTCSKEYQSTTKDVKLPYCSECSQNKQFKTVCIMCGKEYISKRRKVNGGICPECVNIEHKHKMDNKLKEYTCETCGKVFKSIYNSKFCSYQCRTKAYRQTENYKQNHRRYIIKRLKEDIEFKLKCNIRSRILSILNSSKQHHTLDYLGYTMGELREHLEKQFKPDMNWDNHGTLWHIDHIRPCASFKFMNDDGTENFEAVRECWKLDNLQPLYTLDNINKGSKYAGEIWSKGEIMN